MLIPPRGASAGRTDLDTIDRSASICIRRAFGAVTAAGKLPPTTGRFQGEHDLVGGDLFFDRAGDPVSEDGTPLVGSKRS